MPENELFIDIDLVLETYNKKNPKKQMTREDLAERLGIHYQNLVNYKMGRVPVVVGTVSKLMEISGLKFNKIVKVK